MKRNLAIGGLTALVVVLVVLNLSMRPDPEPAFEPAREALPQRAEPRRVSPDSGAPAVAVEGVTEDPAADPLEPAVAEPAEVEGCDHRFVPARDGQWRRYRWTISTEEHVAEITIRAQRTRSLPGGEREVVWLVRANDAESDERLDRLTLRTRCRPGQDAEEPWFGILEASIRLRLTRATARWRWPAELHPAASFRGTASFDPANADARAPEGVEGTHMLTVTRTHIVGEQTQIEVPAGTFTVWPVAYEETQAFGRPGETGSGTIWVAEDVGLVRSRAENSEGIVQTIELVRQGDG